MARPKKHPQTLDARGRVLIERRNLPSGLGSTLVTDGYHFLRTASWTRIVLLFAAIYVAVNVLFATILWLGHASVTNATGFMDYFWFSVQTLATIGYGVLAPNDTLSHVIVTIESFLGFGLTALVTGVFFARFSTPSPRIIFSSVAVVADYDGQRMLMFRLANARQTAIVEASVHLYMTRDGVLGNGERYRRIYDLELRRTTSPVFNLSWTVFHLIDERSPLFGVTAETIREGGPNIIVTFQGIDDSLATVVHTRFAYNADDLVFDRRFADIIKSDAETGTRYLDFGPFHTTEPLPSSSGN
ncbi:MAG: ion channel [Proteobacteria bacterium]|nr:ion channel [Pseudomonadota bacterium]